MSSKLDYLSKYYDDAGGSDDDGHQKKKKKSKKKKEKKAKKAAAAAIIHDEEDDVLGMAKHDETDSDEEDGPLVVGRAEEEGKASTSGTTRGQWVDEDPAAVGRNINNNNNNFQSDSSNSGRPAKRRTRYDSDDNSNSDADNQQRKPRYDSDSDNSDKGRRKRYDSDSDRNNSSNSRSKKKRYDSDSDGSDGGNERRPRYDSDSDSDARPSSRKQRHDSDSDHSNSHQPKNKRKRYDSDDQTNNSRSDSDRDDKPNRRQRYDSDDASSDDNHPKKRHKKHKRRSKIPSSSPDHRRRRRHDSSDSSSEDEEGRPTRMASGHKAGLQQAGDFAQAEAKIQSKRKAEANALVDEHGMSETVYRDAQGRKQDPSQAGPSVSAEELAHQKYVLNQGKRQQQALAAELQERQKLAASGFARTIDDDDLEAHKKQQLREGDPMAQYAATSSGGVRKTGGAISNPNAKPMYKGPPAPPNRFGIKPGYRWDGNHRGNGWESKLLAHQMSQKRKYEGEYR